jgi:hypothetical protein
MKKAKRGQKPRTSSDLKARSVQKITSYPNLFSIYQYTDVRENNRGR